MPRGPSPSLLVAALLSLAGATQLRARAGVAPHTRRASPRAMAGNPKPPYATAEELERELRAYVGALSADALNDESLPPPLGYAELSRNGRDDLAKAVLEMGGYIQYSKALGLRWASAKGPARAPFVEVDNFDSNKALRSGFLKLGSAQKATEDVLEVKKLSDFESREQVERERQRELGRGKLASLLQPSETPYVNTADDTPGRQLLVDLQLSLPQRATALLLAWALAAGWAPHPVLPLDADTLLVLRLVSGAWLGAQAALGAYTATLASAQQRNALLWFAKTAATGVAALVELRAEGTRLQPTDPADLERRIREATELQRSRSPYN